MGLSSVVLVWFSGGVNLLSLAPNMVGCSRAFLNDQLSALRVRLVVVTVVRTQNCQGKY
jgi:hypothetical protein